MARKPELSRISVLWGAYRLKRPRTKATGTRNTRVTGMPVYGAMLLGTANRVKIKKLQRKSPKAFLLRANAGNARSSSSESSEQPINTPPRGKRSPYPYLWVPKVQNRFTRYIWTVGTRDYKKILDGKLSPSNARWSRIGVPRELSIARHVANLCRFSETGVFRTGGRTYVLSLATKNALGSKTKAQVGDSIQKVGDDDNVKDPREV